MFEIPHGLAVPSLGFWASSEKISLNCCGLISLVCRKSFVGCSSIAALLPVCLWLISSSEILCKYYRKSKEARPWYMSSFLSVLPGASLSVNIWACQEHFDCICSHLYGWSNSWFLFKLFWYFMKGIVSASNMEI